MLSRKFVFSTRTSCLQRLQYTWQNMFLKDDLPNKKQSKNPKSTSVSKAVRNYLVDAGLEYYIDNIPNKLLRKHCAPTSKLCLFDSKTAKELSLMFSKDLLQNNSFVVECNPGLGLLTQELLKIGVPTIHLYEKYDFFCGPQAPLGKLIAEHNKRLDLRPLNFFDIWLTLLRDNHMADDASDTYLTGMPHHAWKSDSFAQIIAFCPSRRFLSLSIHNFFQQTKLFEHGRPTFFLVLPLDVWRRLTVDNTCDQNMIRYYNQYNVLLHLFFEYEYLGEVPREAFAPWPRIKDKKTVDEIDLPMQVIKLEPKSNTFDLISREDLRAFWYFLKHCMRSKTIKVIREMEKWIPGCGPRLIFLEHDILTKFKELSPTQLFEMFQNFRTWPEYDENFFSEIIGSEAIRKEEEEEKIELEEVESESGIQDENKDDGNMRHSSIV